jgi:hypothetical protein
MYLRAGMQEGVTGARDRRRYAISGVRLSAVASPAGSHRIHLMAMGDFENILPHDLTDSTIRSGQELVFPFEKAHRSVEVASENLIAVLGVEVFRILQDGLGVLTYSGYAFDMTDWKQFVALNNKAALSFLNENKMDHGFGYILTATSQREFVKLGDCS